MAPDRTGVRADATGADDPHGEETRPPVPWEDPSVPFPSDLWRTWGESLLRPSAFFGRLEPGGRLDRAVLYLLLAAALAAAFTLFRQLALPGLSGERPERAVETALWFFLSPFAALLSLLLSSLVFHLGALVFAPRHRGLRATARAVCYTWGPAVLAVVPILGPPAALVWQMVLQVLGLRAVHRTSTGRAILIVFWLPVLLVVTGFLLGLLVVVLDPGALRPSGEVL